MTNFVKSNSQPLNGGDCFFLTQKESENKRLSLKIMCQNGKMVLIYL